MIKKEEILLYAIGKLPEDMITEEDIDSIKAGALQIEKEERKKHLIHYIAATAACVAALIISASVYNRQEQKKVQEGNIKLNRIYSSTNNSNDSEKKNTSTKKSTSTVSVFTINIKEKIAEDSVYSSQKNVDYKNYNTDIINSDELYNMEKIPYNKTVDLQLSEQTYIVFSIDTDFHLSVSNKKNKAYIIKANGKKRYIKESKTLCKAGSTVYLNINGSRTISDVAIPEWEEKGISVIACAKTNQSEDGIFYVGKATASSEKNNKKGDIYYGIFIKEN